MKRTKRTSLILVTGTLVLAATAGLASAEPPQRTIFGTNANDALRGTSAAEFIFGLAGNDAIHAAGGDDIAFGGAGSDALSGGTGDDTIIGGSGESGLPDGNDLLSGGSGDDQLIDEAGNNLFFAGSGDDFVRSRNGHRDIVSCGGGSDRVVPDPVEGLDIISGDCEVRFQGQG